jgi:hypothetical protein
MFAAEMRLVFLLMMVTDSPEAPLADFPALQGLGIIPIVEQKFNVLFIFVHRLQQPLRGFLLQVVRYNIFNSASQLPNTSPKLFKGQLAISKRYK